MIRSASFGTNGAPPAKQPAFSFGNSTAGPSSTSSFSNINNNSSGTAAPAASQANTGGGGGGGFSFGGNTTSTNTGTGTTLGVPNTTINTTTNTNTNTASMPSFSFGGTPATAAPSQPQTQTQTGVATNTNPNTSSSSSLFGGLNTSTVSKQPAFSFGNPQPVSTGTTGTATGGLLFGSQPATTTTSGTVGLGTSLFGAPASSSSSSLAAGFGQSQSQSLQQQQQQQGGGGIGGIGGGSALLSHPFYQKERFNDLSDEARKLVEEMDKMISSQVSIRDELHSKLIPSSSSSSSTSTSGTATATGTTSSSQGVGTTNAPLAPLGQQISSLYSTLHEASIGLANLSSSLEGELVNIKNLTASVQGDRADLNVLWEIGMAFREGRGIGDARRDWIRDYFTKAAEDFRSRILRYRGCMEQVERHLSSLSSRDSHSPHAISDTIYFQHTTFMQLAGQVASIHSEVEVLKRDYRNWYAQQFRSVRDPFEIGQDDAVGVGVGALL